MTRAVSSRTPSMPPGARTWRETRPLSVTCSACSNARATIPVTAAASAPLKKIAVTKAARGIALARCRTAATSAASAFSESGTCRSPSLPFSRRCYPSSPLLFSYSVCRLTWLSRGAICRRAAFALAIPHQGRPSFAHYFFSTTLSDVAALVLHSFAINHIRTPS